MLITKVDYHKPQHKRDLTRLLNNYALDPMGGGQPLADSVKAHLVEKLAAFPTAISFLAYEGEQAIGLVNAFLGFSTFQAKPLCNIHDVVVDQSHRGKGVARQLLAALEVEAKSLGCCKLTLEVLAENQSARKCYQNYGFKHYALDPKCGGAEFWEKSIVNLVSQ